MSQDDVSYRWSRRARRLRIDVSHARGAVVVVPQGTHAAVVDAFVEGRRDWIRRARARLAAEAAATVPADALVVPECLELRALGRSLPVEVIPAARARTQEIGGRLRVEGDTAPAAVRPRLAQWLKREAGRTLVPRLEALAAAHDLPYQRASVRGQRTRWASCSGRGTISINFRLLFLPHELVDHVLLHELAHTRHLDHSQRFWRLLARLDPAWRDHHQQLRRAREWIPAWVEMD